MATFFISDLHLHPEQPTLTELFLQFLQTKAAHAESLYILGDLFEVWLGDDALSSFHEPIISALRRLTDKGIKLYFMHGNRDFLVGENFARLTGCELLTDPCLIDLYGEKTLLMHGDTLCLEDTHYLQFRNQARNPLFQQQFLTKPLAERQLIAKQIRLESQKHTHNTNEEILDATPEEIKRLIKMHQVNLFIHGHTHRPSLHYYLWEDQAPMHIVLSDWDNHQANALVCDATGQKRLMYWSEN